MKTACCINKESKKWWDDISEKQFISDPRSAGTSSDGARREGEGEDIGQGGEPLQPDGLRSGREDMRGGILADHNALQGCSIIKTN